MRLILFCEQTGTRLDPKRSAADCATQNRGDSDTNCPLMPRPLEPNQSVSALPPTNTPS